MTDWLMLGSGVLILCFGFVLLKGAPYLPTLKKQQDAALDMLELKSGATLLELGSGDGRILLAGAKRGWNVVGYELNPVLAIISWLRTYRYRNQVRVVWGSFWSKEWPPADAIFTFLLPKYMSRLDKKIIQYQLDLFRQDSLEISSKRSNYKNKLVKLVSIAFIIPSKKPTKSNSGVYLYHY